MKEEPIVPRPASINSHLEAYLRTGGVEGHVLDSRGSGGHSFGTALMIRYRGRKSGRIMITPLTYGSIGGEVAIIASKGGSPDHPAWYLNLTASPEVDFQIGTQAFRASWREPAGAEREKVWSHMVDCYPYYGEYLKRTDRKIPVVLLRPIEAIPVFRESDLN